MLSELHSEGEWVRRYTDVHDDGTYEVSAFKLDSRCEILDEYTARFVEAGSREDAVKKVLRRLRDSDL